MFLDVDIRQVLNGIVHRLFIIHNLHLLIEYVEVYVCNLLQTKLDANQVPEKNKASHETIHNHGNINTLWFFL